MHIGLRTAAVALMVAAPGALAAQSWGGVGIGPNGEYGFSHSYGSQGGAYSRVRAECPSCTTIETFYNTCGAMALGSGGAYGYGWAPTRAQAESNALGYCSNYGPNCRALVWACSF